MLTTDLSTIPEYVLTYFAHMDKAYAGELIRRRRVEATARVEQFFTDEVAEAKRIAEAGTGAWGKVVDFLLGRRIQQKMSEHHVTLVDFVTFAGITAPAR